MKKQFLYRIKRRIRNNIRVIESHSVVVVSVVVAIVMSILCFGSMICEPRANAESYGKKVYPAGGSTYISSEFRTPSRPTHNGIDILRGDGKLYAVDDGIVVMAKEGCTHDSPSMSCECNGGCGNYVEILHEDGYRTKYLHMKANLFVNTGDKVTKGQHIGMMGSTGRSSAVHLHFTVINPAGEYVFPNDYIGGEFAELPPQKVKLRLSKELFHPYQPMILTYTAQNADFYIVHFYDKDGVLIKTLNSKNEASPKSMVISFDMPGKYSVSVEAYNETGKAKSEKISFQVFEGAVNLNKAAQGMLKKAKKANRGKKRTTQKKLYNLHTIERCVIETTPQPEVHATPSLPPQKKADKNSQSKKEKHTVKKHKKNKKQNVKVQQKVLKKKGFEYRLIKKQTAVKILRYIGKSKNVIIPEKIAKLPVKVIGNDTFVNEKGITKSRGKIIFSKSVQKLEKGIKLPAAKSYKVDKRNIHFCSENGVLYNKKKTTVLRYPVLNTKSDAKRVRKNIYMMRKGVKRAAQYAFVGASFSGYVLPEGFKYIGLRAFENNAKLTTIKLPKTVDFIGADAFAGSYELKRVDLYSKNIPNICLNSAVFASAKVYVPQKCAFKRYDGLSEGGYMVNERRGEKNGN